MTDRPGAARPLSREDLSILALETDTVAGHTCKVIMLRDGIDAGALQSSIAGRLAGAPELRLRLGERDGAPWWLPDDRVDLGEHVVAAGPPGGLDEAQFRASIARLFEQRLDRSRPLWRIDVLPRVAGGGSAVVWRLHHALADGSTGMRLARAVLWDTEPAGSATPAAATRRKPAGRQAHDPLSGLLAVAREAPQPWLRSPFDGHIDARRAIAFAAADLAGLHRVAGATNGATVNDAVLAVVAGGLRRWLEAQHGHLGPVRVKVPVSMHGLAAPHGDDDGDAGNRDSFFCLDLPLGSADPLERLAAIRQATRVRKQCHDAQHVDALMEQLARVPVLSRFAERVLTHPRSFALNVSNVPGPRRPVAVLGTEVDRLFSLAEIREHHALRVAVVSLAGTLGFGLVADPTLLTGVDRLAADMQAEADDLIALG